MSFSHVEAVMHKSRHLDVGINVDLETNWKISSALPLVPLKGVSFHSIRMAARPATPARPLAATVIIGMAALPVADEAMEEAADPAELVADEAREEAADSAELVALARREETEPATEEAEASAEEPAPDAAEEAEATSPEREDAREEAEALAADAPDEALALAPDAAELALPPAWKQLAHQQNYVEGSMD